MSGWPVAFTSIPRPARTDLADFPAMSAAQAKAIDANFALINQALAAYAPGTGGGNAGWSSAQVGFKTNFVAGSNAFTAAEWPAVNLTVPNCLGLLVTIGGHYTGPAAGYWIGVLASLFGPGIRGNPGSRTNYNANKVLAQAESASSFIPRDVLVIGQALTATPYYVAQTTMTADHRGGLLSITALGV